MPNHKKLGYESQFIKDGHGKVGHVQWRIETEPDLKSKLVLLADKRGVTLKAVYTEAFEQYLNSLPNGHNDE